MTTTLIVPTKNFCAKLAMPRVGWSGEHAYIHYAIVFCHSCMISDRSTLDGLLYVRMLFQTSIVNRVERYCDEFIICLCDNSFARLRLLIDSKKIPITHPFLYAHLISILFLKKKIPVGLLWKT